MHLLNASVLAALLLAACGGDDAATVDASGASADAPVEVDVDAAPAHAVPPAEGAANAPDGDGPVTFAISKLNLGTNEPDGSAGNADTWKTIGYDVDGLISVGTSTNLCLPRASASTANVYPDGDLGIDNSFGRNILPIFLGVGSDTGAQVNAALDAGKGRPLFTLFDLGSDDNYSPLHGNFVAGLELDSAPAYDGTDEFPVDEDTVEGDDVEDAVEDLPSSYLVGDTWVAGPMTLRMNVSMAGHSLPIVIHDATVTMVIEGDREPAVHGLISGVLDTEELTTTFATFAGSIDPSLCPPSATTDSIVTQMEQASDILADGTQESGTPCTGISIGLAFEAERVLLGDAEAGPAPEPDPCDE